MSLHTILVFVHVISAIALSSGALLSVLSMIALRRASRIEQARSILELLALSEPVIGIALILTPAIGLIMTFNTWGWQNGWINVALGSMVLLMLPVGAIAGTRRRTIVNLVNKLPDGDLPEVVKRRIHDPVLGTATYMLAALVLGIEFLMTTKPTLDVSVVTILVSVMLGFAAGIPLWRGGIGERASSPNELTN